MKGGEEEREGEREEAEPRGFPDLEPLQLLHLSARLCKLSTFGVRLKEVGGQHCSWLPSAIFWGILTGGDPAAQRSA